MARISVDEKARVRVALLRTAAEHFAQEGYEGASINRISLSAGFAKGTVYNYFSSKAALLSAVLQAGGDETLKLYRSRPVASGVRARLVALARADVEVVRAHETFFRVVLRELVSGRVETQRLIDESTQSFAKEIASILAAGKSARPLEEQTRLFLGQLTILYIEQFRSDGTYPGWHRLPELVVDTFLDGVTTP
ncbi:MAG: AcrR family transcriptional regulator [Polyangiales bacterium]|jgi:AcrR family transcriptional regulator